MKEKTSPVSLFSGKLWISVFVHMRPYLLFVSGAAGLAGMAIAPVEVTGIGHFLMAFIPFFLGYGFGQALTDCFQVDTDSISAPYRPLSKGDISPRLLGIISFSGLIMISLSLILLNYYNLFFGMLSIIGLTTYTYFKKHFWFAGPFYNGWIVSLLPVMGVLAVTACSPLEIVEQKLIFQLLLTFFSYANFVVIGYLKDISADRATNYKTFPVIFGWNKTIIAGDFNVILSMIFAFLLIGFNMDIEFIVLFIASVIAIAGQIYGHITRNKNESNATFPITATVRSFILWHIAVVAHYRPGWIIFCALFYLCFEFALFLRPEKGQI